MMTGLTTINIELTSRCNKNCWCCGRRKREREDPKVLESYGDMDIELLKIIAGDLERYENLVLQFHNNGEPLLYPELGNALRMFRDHIKTFDTNGILLLERFDDFVDYVDTIAVSVIQNDPDQDAQFETLKEFLKKKGGRAPLVVARLNGSVDPKRYEDLGIIVAKRILHDPMGSFHYLKSPTVPEIGVCLDLLHHLSIDRNGNVSCCVRFDPDGSGMLGNVRDTRLESIWTGFLRRRMLVHHMSGERNVVPLCKNCDYWGVPTGW